MRRRAGAGGAGSEKARTAPVFDDTAGTDSTDTDATLAGEPAEGPLRPATRTQHRIPAPWKRPTPRRRPTQAGRCPRGDPSS